MRDVEERFTTYAGRPLRYVIGGRGPHLLLCHGFIGSAENFDDWEEELLKRRTVIAPDFPGFGKSPPLSDAHTAEAFADAALRVVDDAGVERFDVAGLCLGACVAMAVQRRRPQTAERVVLHTPLLTPWLTRRRFHAQSAFMLATGVYSTIVWLSRRRAVSDLYKRLMIEGGDAEPTAAQVNFDNQRRATPRAAREWLRDGIGRDDLHQLCTMSARALVLVAAQDRIVDVPRLQRVLDGIPNVEVAAYAQGGHAWTRAMVDEQCRLLGAFLDDRPLPGAAASAA